MGSRRKFLTALLCGAPALSSALGAASQHPLPAPQKPGQKDKDDDDATPKFDVKTTLEANKKDIKKDVEKLFQLAGELKAEVEKSDSVQVLSLAMVKKTEEIEKLAKAIRLRAIG